MKVLLHRPENARNAPGGGFDLTDFRAVAGLIRQSSGPCWQLKVHGAMRQLYGSACLLCRNTPLSALDWNRMSAIGRRRKSEIDGSGHSGSTARGKALDVGTRRSFAADQFPINDG